MTGLALKAQQSTMRLGASMGGAGGLNRGAAPEESFLLQWQIFHQHLLC
jgi:hypothetical protein